MLNGPRRAGVRARDLRHLVLVATKRLSLGRTRPKLTNVAITDARGARPH
jgi:hypothetical protein